MTEEDSDALLAAAVEQDVQSMLEVMGRVGDAVFVNEERSALQGKGCGDEIALHIPLSTEVLDAVVAAMD